MSQGTEPTARSPLRGIKLLNMGKPGTGKTSAIKTIMDSGLECFAIFTEAGGNVVTGDERLHYRFITTQPEGWDNLKDVFEKTQQATGEGFKKIFADRNRNMKIYDVLSTMRDFVDERTGKSYGPVESWGTDRCLCFDSTTGIIEMFRDLAGGNKPALTWPEYEAVQRNALNFINKLWDLRCHVYITAHIDMIVEQISGLRTIMAHTIGKELSPLIHVNATDAVLSTRSKMDFKWSAAYEDAMVKAQNIPMDAEYPQDFSILLENWKSRGGMVESGAA